MDYEKYVLEKGKRAKAASRELVKIDTATKNKALQFIKEFLDQNRNLIKTENEKDLKNGKEKGLTNAFIDRLTLNDDRITGMMQVLDDVSALTERIGEIKDVNKLENGLDIKKMRVPLGVVGFIFESRPNVCIEASALCLKSSNAIILRGGSDAVNSNKCLTRLIREGIKKAGIPESAVEVIEETDRETVTHLVKMKEYVDVIIPRGGYSLIKVIEEQSLIPVIRHDAGLCHTYVDEFANVDMAIGIAYNAKVQRPGVCNSMETLLVHKAVAKEFLPKAEIAFKKGNVELRGCKKTKAIIPSVKAATEEDWSTEYLDLILSIKVVDSFDEAVDHINTYGSHHSDAIVTNDETNAKRFLTEVDSATCYINASTRFTDGNVFGLGAEMGISNQKLHVRGPMALEGLTSEKFIILGNGHIRE
jgi:glutamate-5-semialdehyde dehydrogenase